MPNRSSKFTDNNLKLFYGNLLNHYKECTKRFGSSNVEAVYRELFLSTQYAVESPQGSLNHLPRWEREKVYTAFHTIFHALPLFTGLSPDKQRSFAPQRSPFNYLNNISPQYIYNCTDPKLFNWVEMNENLNPNLSYLHKSTTVNKSDKSKHSTALWAGIIIVGLVFSAAAAALTAWYYLFYQFMNSAERLWYKEGWMRAILMSAAALTFSSLASTLTLIFAAEPIVLVALAFNLNPVGMLIAAGICVASVGAGLGAFAMNSVYDFVERRSNKRTIDSSEPLRFAVSEDEEDVLVEKQIDPMKVKCALVAIRIEINRILNSEDAVPSFLNRQFGNSKYRATQPLLQMARALRRGDLTEASIGDLKFDCRFYEPLRKSELLAFRSNASGLYPSLFNKAEEHPLDAYDLAPPQLKSA